MTLFMTSNFVSRYSFPAARIALLAAAAALLTPAACSVGANAQTLVGYVQSSATDENDNPTDIFLFDGKNEYQIKKNDVQQKLLDLVDRKISAQAVISEGWGGKKIADIEEYKVVE